MVKLRTSEGKNEVENGNDLVKLKARTMVKLETEGGSGEWTEHR